MFLKVADGSLSICVDVSNPGEQGHYLQFPVTPSFIAQAIVHYQALGKAPKTPQKRQQGDLSGFDEFWRVYPKKEAKQAARQAWKAQSAARSTAEIIADVSRRAASEDWTKQGGKYVPYAATYLNQRRWEDGGDDRHEDEGWL